VKWSSDTLTEIMLSELDEVVDLFVLDRKLATSFDKNRVLVVPGANFEWPKVTSQLSDLR